MEEQDALTPQPDEALLTEFFMSLAHEFVTREKTTRAVNILTGDERERLRLLEDLCYDTTGLSIDLVELCESWLATDDPIRHVKARFLIGGPESAVAEIDRALAETQPEVIRTILHAFRGFCTEGSDPVAALSEYATVLRDIPPSEAREMILAARRRVIHIAN